MRQVDSRLLTGTTAVGTILVVLAACAFRPEAGLQTHQANQANQSLAPTDSIQAGDCLEFSEGLRTRSEATIFIGFGESSTSDDATIAASADLVRQIQTKISSSGVTQESNRNVEISSLTQSSVEALLTGLGVAKRCRDGNRWQVVTRLEKAVFFRNIQLRVQPLVREAATLRQAMQASDSPPSELLSTAARAKAFVRNEAAAAKDLIAVCKTFNSCAMLNESDLAGLEVAANGVFTKYAFSLRAKDNEANAVSDVVSRLLSEEGFAISSNLSGNEAGLTCQRKDFPPMAQTGYMVTEILCGVVFTAGSGGDPVTGLTRTFLGNGLGESREEALSEARRKLARHSEH